jgi:hypothetical protein
MHNIVEHLIVHFLSNLILGPKYMTGKNTLNYFCSSFNDKEKYFIILTLVFFQSENCAFTVARII